MGKSFKFKNGIQSLPLPHLQVVVYKISSAELQIKSMELLHKMKGVSSGELKSCFQKLHWHCRLSIASDWKLSRWTFPTQGAWRQMSVWTGDSSSGRYSLTSWLSMVLIVLDCHCLKHLSKVFLLLVLTVLILHIVGGIAHLQMGFQALCSSLINWLQNRPN